MCFALMQPGRSERRRKAIAAAKKSLSASPLVASAPTQRLQYRLLYDGVIRVVFGCIHSHGRYTGSVLRRPALRFRCFVCFVLEVLRGVGE